RSIFIVWTTYCLTTMPIFPLLDGIHFSQQRRRCERGEKAKPYHLVRVWGTIGFITPSLLLFVLLRLGMPLRVVLFAGSALSVLAAVQARWVGDPRGDRSLFAGGELALSAAPPTLHAAAALLRPPMLVFSAAILLMSMSVAVHSAFYPVYLTERVGLSDQWLGPMSNIAVICEALF